MQAAGEIGYESQQHKATSNGIVSDVLLCKNVASSKSVEPEFVKQCTQAQQSGHHEGAASSFLGTCQLTQQQGGGIDSSQTDFEAHTMSNKELERRQKLRDKKRVQRQNEDYAERERLRARGRIKALREDPVFREGERLRDRDRRRKARLLNQTQRMQERDRDKLRKSIVRSLDSKSVKRKRGNSIDNVSEIG